MQFFQLVLLSCLALVQSYPGGAPSCKIDVPSHAKTKAQTGKSPFTVVATAPKALPNGDRVVTITISGGKGKPFKGFHVTARAANAVVGKFTAAENSKVLQCSPSSNAITHKNNSDKTSVSFTWTAPKKLKGKVEFKATIVKDYKEFYTNVRSQQLVF